MIASLPMEQVRQSGLPADFVRLPDATLVALVDGYTREAGLRSLEREVAALCRAVAVELAKLPPGKEREAAPVITVSAPLDWGEIAGRLAARSLRSTWIASLMTCRLP